MKTGQILKPLRVVFVLLVYFGINSLTGAKAQTADPTRDTVKIRVTATNPKGGKKKKVPIKVYLPPEVRKENVIGTGGLELLYDSQESMYYVEGEIELEPGDTRVFNVEVEDVWYIREERMGSLRERAKFALDRLKDTEHYDAGKKIAETVNERLAGIVTSQTDDTISRKDCIATYRTNLSRLEQIREDVDTIEKYAQLASSGARPIAPKADEEFIDKPSKTLTWMVIFIILTFIGMLGGVFFFFWTRHARALEVHLPGAEETDFTESKPPTEGGGTGTGTGGTEGT